MSLTSLFLEDIPPSRVLACLPLPSLEHLDGPPTFTNSLASLAKLTTLETLTVHFYQTSSTVPLLEDVLACAAHFPNLDELQVCIPSGIDCHLLETPWKPDLSCLVKMLFLMCLDSAKHNIIVCSIILLYTLLLNDIIPDSHTARPGWRPSHRLTDSTWLLIVQGLIGN